MFNPTIRLYVYMPSYSLINMIGIKKAYNPVLGLDILISSFSQLEIGLIQFVGNPREDIECVSKTSNIIKK